MARLFVSANSEALTCTVLPISSPPFSVACWFQATDLTTNHPLLSIADSAASNQFWALFAAGARTGDPVLWQARAGGIGLAESTTAYTADTWHHAYACEIASNDREVRIDGGSIGTNSRFTALLLEFRHVSSLAWTL